jgi:hypothetical protein
MTPSAAKLQDLPLEAQQIFLPQTEFRIHVLYGIENDLHWLSKIQAVRWKMFAWGEVDRVSAA